MGNAADGTKRDHVIPHSGKCSCRSMSAPFTVIARCVPFWYTVPSGSTGSFATVKGDETEER